MSVCMPNWLLQRAYLTPQRTALVYHKQEWTFADMANIVLDYAGSITLLSIRDHDRVAILMNNRPELVWMIHALQQLGVEMVMLNTRLTVHELAFQINDSNAKVLIYDEDYSSIAVKLQQMHPHLQSIKPEELKTSSCHSVESRREFHLDEVSSIMYTSGTTGKPKGVLQTYGNHWWSATGSALNLGIQENDAWLCAVPLFHISGYSILIRSVIYGIPVYLMESFDETSVNELLCSGNITIMSVVSAMLNRMLQTLAEPMYHPNFRCMLLGGGPAPRPLLETCVAKKVPVYQTYGMTETASQIVTLSPDDSQRKLGSAGKPLFPAQVNVQLTNGESAPPGKIGEILLKGPNVTKGYLNRPEVNETVFQDGWLKTGDLGYLDEEGFLYIVDRRSDLIISGGENIYPAELEEVLMAHEAIVDAGVTGLDDRQWGQVPIAFFVAKRMVTENELLNFCRERLAAYKLPKRFVQVTELPRNAANKLLRRKLHEYL